MTYYNLSAINSTHIDIIYTQIAVQNPWLMPLILAFEFLMIMLSGMGLQSKRIGFNNAPMWGTIAGMVTTVTSFIWSGVSSSGLTLVNLTTIGICFAVTVGFAILFFFQDLE